MKEEQIGIFGGSFDPVHNAHIAIAEKSIDQLGLDLLYIVPVNKSPHKQEMPVASPQHRFAMLKAAFNGKSKVKVSMIEIKREGISYTVDTVKSIADKYPKAQLYLIVGSDNLKTLDKWKSMREIRSLCRIAVASRPNSDICAEFLTVNCRPISISSSQIRDLLCKSKSVKGLVPNSVEAYIKKNALYTRC